MVGRPDLASGYAAALSSPVVGGDGQYLTSGVPMISGSLTNTVSGNIGTGQLSLGMVAALVVLMFILYMWTRGHQH